MSGLTDNEWGAVKDALLRGGLRQCLDDIVTRRENNNLGLPISDVNRGMLLDAYDDGDGNTITLERSTRPNWFIGVHNGEYMMEGTEIDGVLYCICSESGNRFRVHVGHELAENMGGVTFGSIAEGRAYIQGLVAR